VRTKARAGACVVYRTMIFPSAAATAIDYAGFNLPAISDSTRARIVKDRNARSVHDLETDPSSAARMRSNPILRVGILLRTTSQTIS